MPNISSLFNQLASLKVTLSLVSNNRIKAVPKELLNDSIRENIRELKPELIKLLQEKEVQLSSHSSSLLNQIESQGLILSLDSEGRIKTVPSELLTEEIRHTIKNQKSPLLTALKEREKRIVAISRPNISAQLGEVKTNDTRTIKKQAAVGIYNGYAARSHRNTEKMPAEDRMKASFRISFPYLMAHLDKLLAYGWTRLELFGRGHYRWPIGDWGVAWLSSWSEPGKVSSIGARGEIVFSFTTKGGEQVYQSAWPLSLIGTNLLQPMAEIPPIRHKKRKQALSNKVRNLRANTGECKTA